MSIVAVLSLLIGLVILVLGAESLVRGAVKLAGIIGISPLVIGLTVVSYGTSAPELAVGIQSTTIGETEIALGNVIGSNVFNILMILGLSAVVVPLTVAQQLIRLDVPIMIGVTALVLFFAGDSQIGHIEGLILLAGSLIYTAFLVWQGLQEADVNIQAEYTEEYGKGIQRTALKVLLHLAYILLGLGLLVAGGKLLVEGAVSIAAAMGVSELIIGLTIVAAGTSLPELATSMVASYRGQRDIAVGNVIGSNIFNILTVLGATAALSEVPVSTAAMRFDLPVMMAVAIACLPIFYTGNRISRWEGMLFIGYYVAYSAYLILDTVGHDQLGLFSHVMLLFVIPLTVVTLLTVLWQRPIPLLQEITQSNNATSNSKSDAQSAQTDTTPATDPSAGEPSPSEGPAHLPPQSSPSQTGVEGDSHKTPGDQ